MQHASRRSLALQLAHNTAASEHGSCCILASNSAMPHAATVQDSAEQSSLLPITPCYSVKFRTAVRPTSVLNPACSHVNICPAAQYYCSGLYRAQHQSQCPSGGLTHNASYTKQPHLNLPPAMQRDRAALQCHYLQVVPYPS
jgi:hypothetical protein